MSKFTLHEGKRLSWPDFVEAVKQRIGEDVFWRDVFVEQTGVDVHMLDAAERNGYVPNSIWRRLRNLSPVVETEGSALWIARRMQHVDKFLDALN